MPSRNIHSGSEDSPLLPHPSSRDEGFTLGELLIVVAVIAILLTGALLNWKTQIAKAFDARRKADLDHIRRAFEDYYNDHSCYPPSDILTVCGGGALQPYLTAIPCDPQAKLPYKYIPIDPSDVCSDGYKRYKVFTSLSNLSDPDIVSIGCSPVTGCGYGANFNFGLSSGISIVSAGFTPGASPTPTGPLPPGKYACYPSGPCTGPNACDSGGICNSYAQPLQKGCPWTYSDQFCLGECSNPINRCLQ